MISLGGNEYLQVYLLHITQLQQGIREVLDQDPNPHVRACQEAVTCMSQSSVVGAFSTLDMQGSCREHCHIQVRFEQMGSDPSSSSSLLNMHSLTVKNICRSQVHFKVPTHRLFIGTICGQNQPPAKTETRWWCVLPVHGQLQNIISSRHISNLQRDIIG